MPPPPPGTVVRTNTELCQMWRALMGPGGFSTSTIWLVFFDADFRMQPVIVPIDDVPAEPDELFVGNLASVIRGLVDGEAVSSVALLLSRPGPRAMTEGDRRWARALRAASGDFATWPMHLATRDRVQVFAPDDLLAVP